MVKMFFGLMFGFVFLASSGFSQIPTAFTALLQPVREPGFSVFSAGGALAIDDDDVATVGDDDTHDYAVAMHRIAIAGRSWAEALALTVSQQVGG